MSMRAMDEATDRSIPELITPEQFYQPVAGRLVTMPERRLMYAILLDAILQLQRRDSTRAAEAELWIRNQDDDWPCSFANVCDALGIEAPRLARQLLKWRSGDRTIPLIAPTRRLQRASNCRISPPRKRRRSRATAVVAPMHRHLAVAG